MNLPTQEQIYTKLKELESRIQDLEELMRDKPKRITGELKARKKVFYDQLCPYVQTYGKGMVRDFYDYWTEENKSGTRMRFELEKTWNISKRLARWATHNKQAINYKPLPEPYKAPVVDDPCEPGEIKKALESVKMKSIEEECPEPKEV